MEDALGRVDVGKDQVLFAEHNIRPFSAPGDWAFEPCSMHYDTVRLYSPLSMSFFTLLTCDV